MQSEADREFVRVDFWPELKHKGFFREDAPKP